MALSDRDRRTLTIGGGVVVAILVAFLLFTMLTGGGEEAANGGGPTPGGPTPGQSPSPTPSIRPAAIFAGRDPFSPPAILSSPSVSPAPSGSGSPTPTGSPTASPTLPGGGSSAVIGGRTIVLLDIFRQGGARMVQVTVSASVHNVSIGESFGPSNAYMLQSISGNCATFLYGDEPFTLCVSVEK